MAQTQQVTITRRQKRFASWMADVLIVAMMVARAIAGKIYESLGVSDSRPS